MLLNTVKFNLCGERANSTVLCRPIIRLLLFVAAAAAVVVVVDDVVIISFLRVVLAIFFPSYYCKHSQSIAR